MSSCLRDLVTLHDALESLLQSLESSLSQAKHRCQNVVNMIDTSKASRSANQTWKVVRAALARLCTCKMFPATCAQSLQIQLADGNTIRCP